MAPSASVAVTPSTQHHPIETDAVVIGAGPVGLWQVFQLGLQGMAAHLIDALPHVGGQCAELYPDKPIYDIPGVDVCTGRELVQRLERQILPFAPQRHLGQQVSTLAVQPGDGRVLLSTTTGTTLLARNVFIAAGVGAFVPRTVKAEGIEAFVGTQVLYHPAIDDAASAPVVAGRHVVVHGGEEAAVAAAIACAERQGDGAPASVSLLHRRDAFQAAPEVLARLQPLRDEGRIRVIAAQITGVDAPAGGPLQALHLTDTEGAAQRLPLDRLFVYLGISPRLGPVADWGLDIERKQLVVDTATFATSVPGIYAVGDINTYPGKRKLILCGFHEATLAAFAAAERVAEAPVALQYTTTSTRLHERLGVASPATH
ncbi:NAD(P)/FAD-dependent oxidoreductase [Paracidovorax wautersii]|uniref:Ferredoxin--NADP reductase n=1 Tax=Paracidovorax wautersii TaxID=1177982 RepID=A0ABU1IG95_9BURK|nr:NAD(P)/FAD-dependent oxidoreductase [Paracidovorax wautersii]MDR6215274.1 thioredoxin reductase (NADPH) [Paracidovorax wautersii]